MNIDMTDFLNKHKKNILNVIVIMAALMIAGNIYKGQSKAIALLRERKESELRKNELLLALSQSEDKMNMYKDAIGKKNVSAIINTISNMAKDTEVNIISLKPEDAQADSFYMRYPFTLDIQADNYHSIGKFISRLESSPDIYIVELLTIKVATEGSAESKLNAGIKLNTIGLKN